MQIAFISAALISITNMRSFSLILLGCFLSGLFGCKTAKAPFYTSRCDSPDFYRRALGWAPGTHKGQHVVVYTTDFKEQKVVSGNVLISPSINRYSNRELAYYDNNRTGYKQELYLVRLESLRGADHDTFIYFTVLYKVKEQKGFSRAYVGSRYGDYAINFYLELYMAEDEEALVLKPKMRPLSRKAVSTHLLFVADSLRPMGDLNFTRIIDREDNKFGGADPYVFEVGKHFTDLPGGLRFYKLADYYLN